ncbi:MAG: DnaJ domain-containing protein [bacterium]|nr:DnaJ domain-containing protein [bacterium]
MKRTNYYNILGLDQNAGEEQIKSAFRRLAKQYHPDVNVTAKNAASIFIIISNAYQILTDKKTKKEYDDYLNKIKNDRSAIRYYPKNDNSIISKTLSEFNYILWDIDDLLKKMTHENLASKIYKTNLYDYLLYLFKYMEEEILNENDRFNNYSNKKKRLKLHLENYFSLLRVEIDKYIKDLEPEIDKGPDTISHLMNVKNRMIKSISEIHEFIQSK